MKKESLAKAADRLREELQMGVTIKCVRVWRAKGWDLFDIPQLKRNLANQERKPKAIKTDDDDAEEPEDFPDVRAEEIPKEIAKLESQLIAAPDYETARMISTKLTGLKNAFRLHVEMGQYVTRESQEREGLQAGMVIKQLILKIPAEMPQMLVGLEYPEAVKKCEDYAHGMLMEIGGEEKLGIIIDV